MRSQVTLTVAESKRLIAKGVANLDVVKSAMSSGLIAISYGSTNAYVAEELLGKEIEKERYLTGHTLPAKFDKSGKKRGSRIPTFIFKDGQVVSDMDLNTALSNMKEGDVFIKGANALNYQEGVAGILIGDSKGGTIGNAIGHIVGRRIRLMIPISLEKCVAFDIHEIAETLSEICKGDDIPRMMAVRGDIITEIEALRVLAGVEAIHIASGGIGGAEGGVRLLIEGHKEAVDKAISIVKEIQGEAPFFS